MPNRPTADRQTPPERDPQFAHLTLGGLREYRSNLTHQESRVSYWRRIIQARLDIVSAAVTGGKAGVEDLRSVFAERAPSTRRTAVLSVIPIDDMPPLPDLASLWSREPDPRDASAHAELIHELSKAETQLSAYRTALHRQLAAATAELIARYREQPDLCLSALPSTRTVGRVTA
ncbi:MAG: RsiG family protein [Mycobacteriales bacterium]